MNNKLIYSLVDSKDPILAKSCEEFNFDEPQIDPTTLHKVLTEMMVMNKGFGLSAPQIGLPYRVFVFGDYKDPSTILSIFNPIITTTIGEDKYQYEGCLSFPDLFIKIKRNDKIRIRYKDIKGESYVDIVSGMTARIIQHEMDHLDGITFIKRANEFHLKQAYNKKRKLLRNERKNTQTNRLGIPKQREGDIFKHLQEKRTDRLPSESSIPDRKELSSPNK